MSKLTTCYFLTVSFYDKYDQYHTYILRGYYDKVYARAVCDRLMKYVIDRSKWMAACKTYLDTHPELLAIPMKDNQYPKTRRKLKAEWESANPLATTAKQHGRSYFITEAPIKTI